MIVISDQRVVGLLAFGNTGKTRLAEKKPVVAKSAEFGWRRTLLKRDRVKELF
jgi:hypothetical protein